jgi:hypothetical protein
MKVLVANLRKMRSIHQTERKSDGRDAEQVSCFRPHEATETDAGPMLSACFHSMKASRCPDPRTFPLVEKRLVSQTGSVQQECIRHAGLDQSLPAFTPCCLKRLGDSALSLSTDIN